MAETSSKSNGVETNKSIEPSCIIEDTSRCRAMLQTLIDALEASGDNQDYQRAEVLGVVIEQLEQISYRQQCGAYNLEMKA